MGVHKVVWKDGMFILPQHFQQMEQYLLTQSQESLQRVLPKSSGFSSCKINREMLGEGLFKIDTASGVMPDGTVFTLHSEKELPPARQIADFITDPTKPITVYLAIPLYWEGRAAYSDTASVHAGRFNRMQHSLADEETGMIKEEIESGRINVTFIFEGESLEGYTALPVSQVQKRVSGAVELVEDFIPALLNISVSPFMIDQLRAISSSMKIRARQLMQSRTQVGASFSEFTSDDMTSLALVQTLSSHQPLLEQLLLTPTQSTPAEVNDILARIAGGLGVFSPGDSLMKLPSYNHHDLAPLLSFYKQKIELLLSHDHTPRASVVPLTKTNPVTFESTLDSSVSLADSLVYLGVTARVNEEELGAAIPGLLKVTSQGMLPQLMMSAMPGVELTPVVNASQKLASKEGYLYYRLVKSGDNWSAIETEKTVACYFPSEYENLQMELVFVKESE